MSDLKLTEKANLVLDFINQTNDPIFLTGKAGTGKTTLLGYINNATYKNLVISAPTGIAALNAKGVTIHSLLQLPFGVFIPQEITPHLEQNFALITPSLLNNHTRISKEKKSILTTMELLVIDEVSMLRADTLDMMDITLRRVRKNGAAFGGCQVLFIGDLLQLPPVVTDAELKILSKYYKSPFFFDARVFNNKSIISIELDQIFRQSDPVFIALLNELRDGRLSAHSLSLLDKYVKPNIGDFEISESIYLTSLNANANLINQKGLASIQGDTYNYTAEVQGIFPEKIYPIDHLLTFKLGTQVMFIRNDSQNQKRYFNGSIGHITYLDAETIKVKIKDSGNVIEIDKHEWENVEYKSDPTSNLIQQVVIGTFVQYPIKVAYAITIHKSQGLTFDYATIDVQDVFQSGQAYVAFSRLRSLEGLTIPKPISLTAFSKNASVEKFMTCFPSLEDNKKSLITASKQYWAEYIQKAFDQRNLITHLSDFIKKNPGIDGIPTLLSNEQWIGEAIKEIKSLSEVSKKLYLLIQAQLDVEDKRYLIDKIDKASAYYIEKYTPIYHAVIERILYISNNKGKKRSKNYLKDLQLLESEISTQIFNTLQSSKIFICNLQKATIDRNAVDLEYIHKFKAKHLNFILEQYKMQGRTIREDIVTATKTQAISTNNHKPKEIKKSTYMITLEMFQKGLSIEQIAAERLLSITTIENHMARHIEEDTLSIDDMMPEEALQSILKVLREFPPEAGLTQIKENLSSNISFGMIRMAKAHFLKKQ